MKFEVDIELDDEQADKITPEMFRQHMEEYVFDEAVSFELSTLPDDPYHERGTGDNYITYGIKSVEVKIIKE